MKINEEVEELLRKIIKRGGVNASQDHLSAPPRFNIALQSFINNFYANFWFEDGKRLEHLGEQHITESGITLTDNWYAHGKILTAEDWFNYAVIMFGRTTPKYRPKGLKKEVLPHIIEFAVKYRIELLNKEAQNLAKETPDVEMFNKVKISKKEIEDLKNFCKDFCRKCY